ncbi:MAG: hypothetical protein ACRDTJ_10950, partial [Pseudonocardiaceae bacterium]
VSNDGQPAGGQVGEMADGLTVVAAEHHFQPRNRQATRSRLAAMLRDALEPGPLTRFPVDAL